MPRQARLDIPGALHHIMVRGINKSDIFKDDEDKSRFVERLGQNVIDGKCSVYAWVLMDSPSPLQERPAGYLRRHAKTSHVVRSIL